jgi:TolA-binding protein
MTLWLLAWGRPAGFDAGTFTGPFLNFMAFGAYLLPLGVLELYLRAQKSPGITQRIGMAAALFVLTLVMGAGIAGAAVGTWIPNMDMRSNKLTDVIAQTIRTQGVDAAIAQYRSLHAQGFPGLYEKESQTNSLGYQFLHGGQTDAAVAVLQLNVEAHPNSANTYDSLGEAYLGAGNKTLAIENYRKALALDPKMNSSINALKKLATP